MTPTLALVGTDLTARENYPVPLSTFPTDAETGTPALAAPKEWNFRYEWKPAAFDSPSPQAVDWHSLGTFTVTSQLRRASATDGWEVFTASGGIGIAQPFSASGSIANIAGGNTIPAGGSCTVTLTGTVLLTAADIAAAAAPAAPGTKTFWIDIFDADFVGDDYLGSVSVTVPAKNGVANQWTSFSTTVTLSNVGGIVVGPGGSSHQSSADVYFVVVPSGKRSNTVIVTAQ